MSGNSESLQMSRGSRIAAALSFAACVNSPIIFAQESEQPPSLKELLATAEQLRQESQWEDALDTLREVVTRRAEDEALAAEAQLRLGRYRLLMAMPAEAEVEFVKVQEHFPDEVVHVLGSHVHLIDALMYQSRNDEALAAAYDLVERARGNYPKYEAWGRVKCASLLRDKQSFDEAFTVLDEMAWLHIPDGDRGPGTTGRLVRGEILCTLRRYPEAIRVLRETIQYAGDECPHERNWARVRLCEALTHSWQLGELDALVGEVIADHAENHASDEQAAWALIWMGRARAKAEAFEEAQEVLSLAAAIAAPNSLSLAFEAEFSRAEALRQGGQHEQALVGYQVALQHALDGQLGEECEDRARLQVGSEMRHLGMRERGIAWLRQGIEDPAKLSGSDGLLADRLVSFLNLDERNRWELYMRNPLTSEDPTALMVAEEFQTPASSPKGPVPAETQTDRVIALARLYSSEKRFDQAERLFEEARQTAVTSRQYAEALSGLVQVTAEQVEPLREQGSLDERYTRLQEVQPLAREASGVWLEIALEGTPGDAHYANEQAVLVMEASGLRREALTTAHDFVEAFSQTDAPERKVVFARLMRTRALGLWNYAPALAARDALALAEELAGTEDSDLQTIRLASLIDAAIYLAGAGEPFGGLELLDFARDEYPSRNDGWIRRGRKLITENYLTLNGPARVP